MVLPCILACKDTAISASQEIAVMGNIYFNSQLSLVTRTFKLPHKLRDSGVYQGLAEYLCYKHHHKNTKEGDFLASSGLQLSFKSALGNIFLGLINILCEKQILGRSKDH